MVIKYYAPPTSGIGKTSGFNKPLVTRGRGLASIESEWPELPTLTITHDLVYSDDTKYDPSPIPGPDSGIWQYWPGTFISVPVGQTACLVGAYSAVDGGSSSSSTANILKVPKGNTGAVATSVACGPSVLPHSTYASAGTEAQLEEGDYLFPASAIGSFTYWVVTLVIMYQQTAT